MIKKKLVNIDKHDELINWFYLLKQADSKLNIYKSNYRCFYFDFTINFSYLLELKKELVEHNTYNELIDFIDCIINNTFNNNNYNILIDLFYIYYYQKLLSVEKYLSYKELLENYNYLDKAFSKIKPTNITINNKIIVLEK